MATLRVNSAHELAAAETPAELVGGPFCGDVVDVAGSPRTIEVYDQFGTKYRYRKEPPPAPPRMQTYLFSGNWYQIS